MVPVYLISTIYNTSTIYISTIISLLNICIVPTVWHSWRKTKVILVKVVS